MLNARISQRETPDQDTMTITEQLRLFSQPVLEVNAGIVSKLAENYQGFSSLALKTPDGKLSQIISEIGSENRVMLNDLYRQLGADSVRATVQEFSSDADYLLRRFIPAPNGITFVESQSVVGNWSAFVVKACITIDVDGMYCAP